VRELQKPGAMSKFREYVQRAVTVESKGEIHV
jgi:hypothetical protein